jgi:hypothetical protein
MGIQINGQTDIISATDGSLTISGTTLDTTNLNITGVSTFSGNVGIGTTVIITSSGTVSIGGTNLFIPTQTSVSGVGATLDASGNLRAAQGTTYIASGGIQWFDYSRGTPYIGVDTSRVLTNGTTYGVLYGRSPATVTTQAQAGKFWIFYGKSTGAAPPSSSLVIEPVAGWKFQLPYPSTSGNTFKFNLADAEESFGSPTVPSSGTYYLSWAHSPAEGEGTTDGDWWSDEDFNSKTTGNGSIYWKSSPGNLGAGISFTSWDGVAYAGGIHFRFETLPKIDLRGTVMVSPNIVDPVFMGTPTFGGQQMFGGQLVYSTNWNQNTTSVEYLSANFMDSIYMVSYALSGSPGWETTYLQFTDHNGTAYTGSSDYISTADWLSSGNTSATLNQVDYAGDEPGLWLSGNGAAYFHNGIYWIIPGAIRNNRGGSTYDPTKSANSASGPWTPPIIVRGMSYLSSPGDDYYRENGGGVYKNASTTVSGFRLIGGDAGATIGSGSSNGWVAVWRFRRTV